MASARQQRFWIYPLLVAGLVACIGAWADRSVRLALEDKLRSELLTALEANVTGLDVWIRTQKRLAAAIASEPTVLNESLALLARPWTNLVAPAAAPGAGSEPPRDGGPGGGPGFGPGRRGFPGGGAGVPAAFREFQAALEARMRPAGFFVAQLVGTNGVVLADTGPGRLRLGSSVNESHQTAFAELFATGEPVIITPFRMVRGNRPRFGGPGGGMPPWNERRFNRPPQNPGDARGANREPGADSPREPRAGSSSSDPGSTNRPPPGTPPSDGRGWRGGGEPGPGGPPGGPGGGPGRGGMGRAASGLMQVAAPVRDAEGNIRGALAFLLSPETEFSRILASVRQGHSGETYAFDDDGLMLSQSRFDPQLKQLGLVENKAEASSALVLRLRDPGGDLTAGHPLPGTNATLALITLVQEALRGDGASGVEVRPSRDVRGVPVVGAWRWLTNHHFGVVTQLDASEAFEPLRVLRSIFLILLVLIAIAAAAALLNSYWNLVWRRKADEAELKLRTLGQYTLEEKIGEGGMGVVHKARHALLRRETAVKLLLPNRATEAAIRQFEREVQLTCQLTHPNTIQIYDFGRTPDGVFYYAMEYLQGINLADLVYRHGPQPEARVLHILAQVCDSLAEAHARGLVHRDIKPANIILCERGGVPDCVKVLDFGLVRPLANATDPAAEATPSGPDESSETHLSGTPLYLPPESIRNPGHAEPRGDLYALGAVGYHLLTGEPPFEAGSLADLLARHLDATPVPPSQRAPAPVSPELERLILACLAKNPAERPASAAELRRLLDACPSAGQWSLDARAAWWRASTARPAVPHPTASGFDPAATVAATLRIDLAGRAEPPT